MAQGDELKGHTPEPASDQENVVTKPISAERLKDISKDCPSMMLPEARPAMVAWLGIEDALAVGDLKMLRAHARVIALFFERASPKLAEQARILGKAASLEVAGKDFRQMGAMFRAHPPGKTPEPGTGNVNVVSPDR
jgi:hypothetical protein